MKFHSCWFLIFHFLYRKVIRGLMFMCFYSHFLLVKLVSLHYSYTARRSGSHAPFFFTFQLGKMSFCSVFFSQKFWLIVHMKGLTPNPNCESHYIDFVRKESEKYCTRFFYKIVGSYMHYPAIILNNYEFTCITISVNDCLSVVDWLWILISVVQLLKSWPTLPLPQVCTRAYGQTIPPCKVSNYKY